VKKSRCESAWNTDPFREVIGLENCPPITTAAQALGLWLRGFARVLVVATIPKTRRDHLVEGKSIKAIARDRGVSRNTLRKVLRPGETAFRYERVAQPLPRLAAFRERLEALLAENEAKGRRERLTLMQSLEGLQAEGFAGSYDAVRRFASRWRREHVADHGFLPPTFAPGEGYQFDWSHEIVVLGGVITKVKVTHIRLRHSRMPFVQAYPRESQEMVFDAHEKRRYSTEQASASCSRLGSPRSRPARSATRSVSPSCRWPRSWATSCSPTRGATRRWSGIGYRCIPGPAAQRRAVLTCRLSSDHSVLENGSVRLGCG
jgi:transposase-like protein